MSSKAQDTYFLDRKKAYQTATLQNYVELADGSRKIQICYHNGAAFENAPDNLISVPISELIPYFTKHHQRLPVLIDTTFPGISQEDRRKITEDFANIIVTIKKNTQAPDSHAELRDTYFLDQVLALKTARRKNRVRLNHPTIDGLQICYYSGPRHLEEYENLIHLEPETLLDFFTETRLRIPGSIILPPDTPEQSQLELSETFDHIIKLAILRRELIADQYLKQATTLQPEFDDTQPLRIFLPASRMTTVMQYCSKNLALAFRKIGCNAVLSIEENDMEQLSGAWILKGYCDANPHVIVNINHINSQWLHPDVFNVTWWQDPMPEITKGEKLPWRDRDLIFSAYPFLDRHLINSGAPHVHRQHFCVDSDCFKLYPDIKREPKIVFIGSSYRRHIEPLPDAVKNRITEFQTDLAQGKLVSLSELQELIGNFVAQYMYTRNYIVRDTVVRWLCSQNEIPVEIYGREWQYDDIIRPHFKGELPHGRAVAEMYNSATHALICMPEFINSQRLVEAAACGCIPVVYDVRDEAEPPHWDEECLFFKTPEELKQCFRSTPTSDPRHIAEEFTYKRMAQRIVTLINRKLGTNY